jgi:hypothetical protein
MTSKNDNSWISIFIFGIIVGAFLLGVMVIISGLTDSPLTKLKINKNSLAKEYVVNIYPEFKNCSVDYKDDICSDGSGGCMNEGVNIYCDALDNRDGLKIARNNPITKTIFFKDITLEDIFKKKIEGMKYGE